MATIAELREKYALHMTVERFVSIRELVQGFSEAYGALEKQLKAVREKLEAVEAESKGTKGTAVQVVFEKTGRA